jgi:hypothetical protein
MQSKCSEITYYQEYQMVLWGLKQDLIKDLLQNRAKYKNLVLLYYVLFSYLKKSYDSIYSC